MGGWFCVWGGGGRRGGVAKMFFCFGREKYDNAPNLGAKSDAIRLEVCVCVVCVLCMCCVVCVCCVCVGCILCVCCVHVVWMLCGFCARVVCACVSCPPSPPPSVPCLPLLLVPRDLRCGVALQCCSEFVQCVCTGLVQSSLCLSLSLSFSLSLSMISICAHLQGGEDPRDTLKCRSFSDTEPLIIGLF